MMPSLKNPFNLVFCINFLLIGCSGGAENKDPILTFSLSDDIKTKHVTFKVFDICDQSHQNNLCTPNLSVHTSISPGLGPNGPLTPEKILAHGNGDCGHFAFLLRAELQNLNIASETISVFASTGSIHAIVEAKTSQGNYLVDPTLGIVYHHDFMTLLKNPQRSLEFDGFIPVMFRTFGGLALFQSVDFIIFNHPTTYSFGVQDISSSLSIDSSKKQINLDFTGPAPDFIVVHFLNPLSFYDRVGHPYGYQFKSTQGKLGVKIPLKNRKALSLVFSQPIEVNQPTSDLSITGENLIP